MDNPPWGQEPRHDPEPGRSHARRFWVTALLLALLLVVLGIRRETVPISVVETTADPHVFLAAPASCNQDARVQVRETATTVTLTATRNRQFCGATGDCQDLVEFELEAPLGNRQFVDGARGEPLGVEESGLP